MIRHGGSVRFTSHELEEFRSIGLDLSAAKSEASVEHGLRAWAEFVAQERPDLLEKIARAMAEAKRVGPAASAAGAASDEV